MKDAPAFDFYPERWLAGTAMLSDAEQLSFLRLLCQQWLAGDEGLPDDLAVLKRAAGKGVTKTLLEKFPLCVDGRRRNAKLESIRADQRERIAKASEKGRKMAAGRWRGANDQEMLEQYTSIPQALHKQCPPPTTHQKESERASAQADGHEHAAREIAALYPRQDAPSAVLEAILADLAGGEDAETLRRQVAACADHIRKAPNGPGNRFVPSAKKFFTDRQWRSPEAFAMRWAAGGNGTAGSPKIKLTSKPKNGW